jgi:hypothetical protein
MSSSVFCLGIPVIDKLRGGYPDHFVLKAKNKEEAEKKIGRIIDDMPGTDHVKVHHIGMRPDKPVPVAMWFCEIEIERHNPADVWNKGLYHATYAGRKNHV